MKKKTYLLSAVYLFYVLGLSLTAIPFFVLMFYDIINNPEGSNIITDSILFVIATLNLLLFIFLSGRLFIQWITVDEQKITARCVFCKLQELKWEEVVEIRIAKFEFGSPGAPAKWLVFYDGKEKYQGNGIITKKGYITLRYSKKREEFIKQLHPEIRWNF